MEENTIDITDAVDELPNERKVIALERACKRLDIETLRLPGGTLQIDANLEDEELAEVFSDELKTMVLDDIMHRLEKDGFVEARVDDNGELLFSLTAKGKQALEEEDYGE